jgi:glycosyl transferase family 25
MTKQQENSSLFARATKNIREYRRLKKLAPAAVVGPAQSFPAFVINLERSPERRLYITSHLRSLGIEPTIIPAYDGKKMSMDQLTAQGTYDDEVSKRSFDRSLSLGEIGCTLSHLSIYQRMIRDNIPVALVVEDDSQFVPDARQKLEALIKSAPADWAIIQLRFDTRNFEPTTVPELVKFRAEGSLPVASTSYLINLAAARVMAGNVLPVRYPADSLLGRIHQWGLQPYGTWPEVVGVNNVFPSAIQGNRNSRFRASNFIKNVLLRIFG